MANGTVVIGKNGRVTQCQKPTGLVGRLVLWNMNSRHSRVTDWGLSHITIGKHDSVLDVGCGGGKTVGNLAAVASEGRVLGIDHSAASVRFARKFNQELIRKGRIEIQEGLVSQLPFPENTFDLVTAVETHFWWPDLPAGMAEIFRVLRPGGKLILIAEVYKGANTAMARALEKHASSFALKLLTIDEHRELFANAGYSEVQVVTEPVKGWICATGTKSSIRGGSL
jgi:ubiquinone/menaquinone biosynthesis C-methylase UbiE